MDPRTVPARPRRTATGALAGLTAFALVAGGAAGCNPFQKDEQPQAGATSGSAAPDQGVDTAALDPGPYPTEPAPEFGRANDDNMLEYEGQRMAEFVLVPFEVDRSLTESGNSPGVMRSSAFLDAQINKKMGPIAKDHEFLYGYTTAASEKGKQYPEPERSYVMSVMRFGDPDKAAAAATEMNRSMLTDGSTGDGDPAFATTPIEVPGSPGTMATTHTSAKEKEMAVNSFTAHGTYVVYTYIAAPEDQRDWILGTTAHAVQAEGPLIDRFPGRKRKTDPGADQQGPAMLDQGKVMIYAVPEPDKESHFGDDTAGYGPRGMAHHSTNPELTMRVLTEAGSVHNAVLKTTVYRGRDDAGGEKILQDFSADLLANGYESAPTPPGLPVAKCFSKAIPRGIDQFCMVRNGRYVGEAGGIDKDAVKAKRDVDQLITAQYLILQKADQHAVDPSYPAPSSPVPSSPSSSVAASSPSSPSSPSPAQESPLTPIEETPTMPTPGGAPGVGGQMPTLGAQTTP